MNSVPTDSTITEQQAASESGLQREGLLTLLLGFAVILVIMNTAMFNLALPDLTKAFSLTSTITSLIVTGYSITFAISSITFSRLSDFLPLRRLMTIGLLTIGLASIAGLFATSFWLVLAVRIIQAMGAGAIISLSMVLFTRYIPLSRRGKMMAAIMSSVSLGLGLGPVAGGAIVEYMGWRYLFGVTALILIVLAFLYPLLPKEKPARGKFDVIGALLVSVSTTALLLFLTNKSWLMLLAGALGLVLFIVRIRRTPEPFVQPALFAQNNYMLLIVIGITSYLCSFATLFLIPQILVHHYEMTASHAGFIIFPGSLLAVIVSRKVGSIIDQYGNAAILRYAPLVILTAVLLFALFAGHSWLSILFVYMVMSLGFTMLSSSVSNEISRILPGSQIGSGMGLFQLLQFFSGAFSVALASSALEWQHHLSLSTAFSNIFWGLLLIAILSVVASYRYMQNVTASLRCSRSSLEA
ncbi:MFS transporter [Paenibacillus massiliensis]|uniref:MFS transporter n=1 Tax=Paenibacillus massiliensis TaxID=225917 RepID=UPI0003776590|nr:MFS transporter [Paenibacillus massiliensis]